jgi:hypothetical protein
MCGANQEHTMSRKFQWIGGVLAHPVAGTGIARVSGMSTRMTVTAFSILAMTSACFAGCSADEADADSQDLAAKSVGLEGAFSNDDGTVHFLAGKNKFVAIEGRVKTAGVMAIGRGDKGQTMKLTADTKATQAVSLDDGTGTATGETVSTSSIPMGPHEWLEVGKSRGLLIAVAESDSAPLFFKRVPSYCEAADDCKAQGLKACSSGETYVCSETNTCGCGAGGGTGGATGDTPAKPAPAPSKTQCSSAEFSDCIDSNGKNAVSCATHCPDTCQAKVTVCLKSSGGKACATKYCPLAK